MKNLRQTSLFKVGENTGWQLAGKAINAISGLTILAIVNHTYGDEGTGIYTLIISYISFFFMPVDFGLNAIATKHIIEKKKTAKEIISNVLGLRLMISIVVVLVAIALLLTLPYDAKTATGYSQTVKFGIVITIYAIIAQAFLSTANALFQAKQKYFYNFITNASSAIVFTIGIALLASAKQPLLLALTSFTISAIVSNIISIYYMHRETGFKLPVINRTYYKNLLYQTLPLTISIILNLVYFRIDSLILPLFVSINDVGYYNTAYKVFENILVIPAYLANALYPVLLERKQQNIQSFLRIIKKSAIVLGILALLGTAILYLLSPLIVQILSKTPSDTTVQYIRILTSGLIFFFLSSITMWSLIVIGKQKLLSGIYAATMIINIILNLSLIPIYGAYASAYITIITEALVLLGSASLLIYHLRRKNYD